MVRLGHLAGLAGLVIGALYLPSEPLADTSGSARNQMLAMMPSTIVPLTSAIADRLVQNAGIEKPVIKVTATNDAVARFCEGTGPETPDIVAASRKIWVSEYDRCVKNGVKDIVAIPIGYSALVLVSRRDDPGTYSLTTKQLYESIAAELPEGDDFHPNRVTKWNKIGPSLPALDINWILPSDHATQGGQFDDLMLQGACRQIPALKNIFAAEERVRQCTMVRRDGHVQLAGTTYESVLAKILEAPPGTLASMPFRMAKQNEARLKVVALDGVTPTAETISNRTYPYSYRLYYFVKLAHMKGPRGDGMVPGIREFITEATRESAIGPTGYLADLGLVPMTDTVRAEAREAVLRLERYER
ncbi:MAG: substrate-binding domain-containing protein [Alphaproteobacteria bacterium]